MLEIKDLTVQIASEDGLVHAVRGASLTVARGGAVGLVGESGSGKTTVALATMGLLGAGARVAGRIGFDGRELLSLPESEMRRVRGAVLAMAFQEPMTALNPVLTVGTQLGEGPRVHRDLGRTRARVLAVELLRRVDIVSPETVVDAFPHQLSGGMRQRVLLAMALACGPSMLIADEPTGALDANVRLQILGLLSRERRERGLGLLLVTHDLSVAAQVCDEVAVMYAGRIVERGPVGQLLAVPRHPYTRGLLDSVPRGRGRSANPLPAIPGMAPSPLAPPPGCAFLARCSGAVPACATKDPALELRDGRNVACWNPVTPEPAHG